MVRGAYVDVGECVGGVQELGWDAEVWDGLPYEERFVGVGVQAFAAAENRGYEGDAPGRGANHMEGLGEEEGVG